MQPLQYYLRDPAAKDNSITHAAAARSDLRCSAAKHNSIPHAAAAPSNLDAAIPMRSATGDSKTLYNYAHTSTLKAASSHRYTAAKKTDKPTAASPKHSPCNIMQPLQCGSQHQLANLHLSTHRTTPEQQMTRVMQPFQCDLQTEIPKHPVTTHTQAHPKQLQATVTLRQKKRTNRPQPQPSHTRGTFHRRLQPLDTENNKVSCSGFLPKT